MSKLRSRSQRSSTPCSSSGRSTLDPTAANLVFSVTTIPPDMQRPSLHGTVGRTAAPPPAGRLGRPALDPAGNGAAPSASSGLAVFLRRLGVDGPSAPVNVESSRADAVSRPSAVL